MALLISWRRASSAKTILVGILLTTLTGCVLFEAFGAREKRFAFGHRLHVVDQGLACEDCHAPNASGEPVVPTLAQCNLCHTDLDSKKPPERQIASLFEAGRMKTTNAIALGDEVLFTHAKHSNTQLECAACHVGMDENDDVLDAARPNMAACIQCHEQKSVARECATCHSAIREDLAPRTHDRLWLRGHGATVCAQSERTVDRCSTCHRDSDCTTCHLSQAPESHTDYWRRRAHGIEAALDRASCATCHRDDSCVRCHSESRPLSHTGSWGAPLDRHCVGCHFPVENEGCAVCHTGTPSHALATPKPPDHSSGMNCRMCHGVGQPLPHIDNGDNCNICHQ
ncbi:MAG: hypothetical protein IT454_01645 [Planctomycetes bacterium]|nr:hypothetical protein [Planctomycetota bacterium]